VLGGSAFGSFFEGSTFDFGTAALWLAGVAAWIAATNDMQTNRTINERAWSDFIWFRREEFALCEPLS
jgi:hypothetical protein